MKLVKFNSEGHNSSPKNFICCIISETDKGYIIMSHSNTCLVCGSVFSARRRDAKTCSSTCRSALFRADKKRDELAKKFNFDMFEHSRWQRISDFSYASGMTIRNILNEQGKVSAVLAMLAVEQAIFECQKMGLDTGYGVEK